jgi:hypothetical protein
MRTDAINWFASSKLCRSLQDGGKTPLTLERVCDFEVLAAEDSKKGLPVDRD